MTATAADIRALRPGPDEFAPFYGKYIEKVGDGDIVRTLRDQVRDTAAALRAIPESKAGHRYAAGKWSIREVVGHVCDAERVFAYRAMRFARGDATPLAGFDENAYIAGARMDERPLQGLIEELEAVRGASVALFGSFFPEEWTRRGNASGRDVSVRALAWIIAGHERHHLEVLRTRYF